MRPASDRPSRARRRGFAIVVTLVSAFGLFTACSEKGTETPAISGENPGEVTIPTLPPTTTADDTTGTTEPSTDTTLPGDDPSDDPTDSSSPTTTPTGPGEGGTDSGDTESDSPETVPPQS